MTPREKFIRTLRCEKIGGQVPIFELEFQLTMEVFRKLHFHDRSFWRWDQMSRIEKKLQLMDMAQLYVDIAEKWEYGGIMLVTPPGGYDGLVELVEDIREISGDKFYITCHGGCTHGIPEGHNMVEFSVMMYEEPEKLNEESESKLEYMLERAAKLKARGGHLLDGFSLCEDYSFNVNPFFSPDMFAELIHPYLKRVIAGYREMGYYTIKHTDGNIMPILDQIADCKPNALHSLDPQGGMKIPEVRKVLGDEICMIGNVHCGKLQTGTEEECIADIMRSLNEGMERGFGYIFSSSNCIYTGMPLERYQLMHNLWRKHGVYAE